MMGDGAHAADMQVFHQLFDHRAEISRQVFTREDGVETVTESKNPEVTARTGVGIVRWTNLEPRTRAA